jgi:hypothetical protein
MLCFPARGAGDHSFATALLDVGANGSAVVAFVAERLLRIAADRDRTALVQSGAQAVIIS